MSRRMKAKDVLIRIFINYQTFENVREFKYLEIFLDEKFNFNKRIDNITNKIILFAYILSRTSQPKSIFTPKLHVLCAITPLQTEDQ